MRMSLQLYQVDQKSFLLDFKSLSATAEDGEKQDDILAPKTVPSDNSIDGDKMMDTDDGIKNHQTLEFFEMCADLITALNRRNWMKITLIVEFLFCGWNQLEGIIISFRSRETTTDA